MSVKLRKRKNADGSTTLLLDIYKDGVRSYEFLKELKLPAGSTIVDRQTRKEHLETAQRIERARATELSENDYNLANDKSKKVLVLGWMNAYAKTYQKADIRVIEGVIKKFSTFLTENKMSGLLMKDFTENIALQFRDKLKKDCEGEGPRSYYSRFRKIVKQAYRDKLLVKNPCEFIAPPTGEARVKDILKFEELQLIAKTQTDAPEVKRAFIFSSVTGLRWIDAKRLTWGSINLQDRVMKVTQSKTKKVVVIPLNSTAIKLLGTEQPKKQLVFDLPSANGCNKSLDALVKRAKIDKHISWHSARHGFGTNLIHNGTDIYTASQLLGHASLTHTKRYVRASSEMNQKAVDNLPKINL